MHVTVHFGVGIPPEVQGPALLEFERMLRRYAMEIGGQNLWVEVFKEAKGDDSKLRASMTKEQRAAL